MKNRVYNSTFGKIMRTLAFLLILFSSGVIVTQLIISNGTLDGVSILLPFAEQAETILLGFPAAIFEYISIMFFIGFLILIWAIRKGIIIRVVLTVALLFMMVYTMLNFSSPVTPTLLFFPVWLVDILVEVEPLMTQVLDISKYILFGLSAGVPLLLWYVFANKKPGRLSVFVLRLGSIALFLAVVMISVATEFLNNMLTNALYMQAVWSLYILAFILFVAGSVFGVLGFSKK